MSQTNTNVLTWDHYIVIFGSFYNKKTTRVVTVLFLLISCLKIYNNKFSHALLFWYKYLHRNYCFRRKQHSHTTLSLNPNLSQIRTKTAAEKVGNGWVVISNGYPSEFPEDQKFIEPFAKSSFSFIISEKRWCTFSPLLKAVWLVMYCILIWNIPPNNVNAKIMNSKTTIVFLMSCFSFSDWIKSWTFSSRRCLLKCK